MKKQTLPFLLWFAVPVAMIVIQIFLELHYDRDTLSRMHSEGGPHEVLQIIFISCALIASLRLLPDIDFKNKKLVSWAIIAAAAGSFYITGEELSWGQHILNWNTPSYWAAINDQGETNLHNTSDWLDQKPRLLLFLGIVVAGLLVPALRRWNSGKLPGQFSSLYPSNVVIPTALGVLIPYVIQEITEQIWRGGAFVRVSEVQELYMYYFVLIYMMDLSEREFFKV